MDVQLQPDADAQSWLEDVIRNDVPAIRLCSMERHGDIAQLIAAMPRAFSDGRARFLNQSTTNLGESRQVISAMLEDFGGASPYAFQQVFDSGNYSFVVQEFEADSPWVGEIAEKLRALTGRRVSATAFLTPCKGVATEAHYDKADVLALQVSGGKQWSVFPPVDPNPSFRTPDVPVGPGIRGEPAVFELTPTSALWVPRGWIHDVRNHAAEPSLHVSFVIFPDTWTSLFANLMDTAYSRLRREASWRQVIEPSGLHEQEVRRRITQMCDELCAEMTRLAAIGIEHFRDHCPNSIAHQSAVERARRSIALLDSGASSAALRSSGAGAISRPDDHAEFLRLSTNGVSYHRVNLRLYQHLLSVEEVSIETLEAASLCAEEDFLHSVNVLVSQLGLFELVEATGN